MAFGNNNYSRSSSSKSSSSNNSQATNSVVSAVIYNYQNISQSSDNMSFILIGVGATVGIVILIGVGIFLWRFKRGGKQSTNGKRSISMSPTNPRSRILATNTMSPNAPRKIEDHRFDTTLKINPVETGLSAFETQVESTTTVISPRLAINIPVYSETSYRVDKRFTKSKLSEISLISVERDSEFYRNKERGVKLVSR